jgi:DNA-binding transcriptional regulator YhcF (GntR family)
MCCVLGAVVGGMVAGRAAVDPKRLRPALRKLVKGGIIATRKIQGAGAAVAQEAKKIVDEARLELDQAGTEQPS